MTKRLNFMARKNGGIDGLIKYLAAHNAAP